MNTNQQGFLKVDRSGRALVLGGPLRRTMSHQVGYYTLEETSKDNIVFQRVSQVPRHGELREPIIFQGDIGGVGSTIEVINFITSTRLSGQLTFVRGEVRKSLYFKEGDLCAARSNHVDDRLSEVLYQFGALQREEIAEAEEESNLLQRPLGNYLLEKGTLNQGQLYLYFKKQVEEIFFSVLLFTQGDFFFTVPHLSAVPSPLNINAQQMLLEGVRRTDEMRRFKERIPSKNSVIFRREGVEGDLSEELQAIVDYLIQPQLVYEVLDHFRVGEFQCYQRLFQLIENGFLEVGQSLDEEQQITPEDLITFYNRAFSLIHQFAQHTEQEDPLESGLSTFLQFYTFSQLFDQVKYDERGRLNPLKLIRNLGELKQEDPFFFIGQALSELLFFQIFGARPWLTEEQREQLQTLFDELVILVTR